MQRPWVTMTAAMMLPSTARHVARLARRVPTLLFTAGYLAVWTGYGLLAYGVFRLATSFDIGWLAWDRGGPYTAGVVIVAAGLYELAPLKRLSLRRCRSTPHGGNALRGGLAHGVDCVGCSGALMAVLFVLGAMSLFWMAVVAVAIFAEKGPAAGSTARARLRGRPSRPRNLGRRVAGERSRTDRAGRVALDGDGVVSKVAGTRAEWLAARTALLAEEKELTRRSDELAGSGRRCQGLWVRCRAPCANTAGDA